MASDRGVFRNVNVLREFNASTGFDFIDVYQPGWLNPYDIVSSAKYSGFMTSLRLTIEISSITELQTIPTEIDDSDDTISRKYDESFNGNRKKCLSFFMRTSTTPTIRIADVFLFNRQPFYYLDLIPYFTNSSTFDIAPDSIISCQFKDVGDGVLMAEDRVILLGSVIEESPKFDQNSLLVE
jgi:hypothetical protein